MILALLSGAKTQTRRVGKIQKDDATELGVEYIGHATKGRVAVADYRAFPKGGSARWGLCECPYGQPGDRLWVKETWGTNPCYDYLKPSRLTVNSFTKDPDEYRATATKETSVSKWRPSIFMPRWASRITLEITGVRVERLTEISEADAKAEGVKFRGMTRFEKEASTLYAELWESINGRGSWALNPWVWAISFKRIGQPAPPAPSTHP